MSIQDISFKKANPLHEVSFKRPEPELPPIEPTGEEPVLGEYEDFGLSHSNDPQEINDPGGPPMGLPLLYATDPDNPPPKNQPKPLDPVKELGDVSFKKEGIQKNYNWPVPGGMDMQMEGGQRQWETSQHDQIAKHLDWWASDEFESYVPPYEQMLLSREEQAVERQELLAQRQALLQSPTHIMPQMGGLESLYAGEMTKNAELSRIDAEIARNARGAKPMSFVETWKRKWDATVESRPGTKSFEETFAPWLRMAFSADAERNAKMAFDRTVKQTSREYWKAQGHDPAKGELRDKRYITEYFRAKAEQAFRTKKWGAAVSEGLAIMPAWMVEYWSSGKLTAALGAPLGNKVDAAMLRVLDPAGRGYKYTTKLMRGLGMAGGRTGWQLGEVYAEATRRQMPEAMFDPKGELMFVPGDPPFKAWLYAFGTVGIENASEAMGDDLLKILRKVPITGDVMKVVDDAMFAGYLKKYPNGKLADYNKMIEAGGYHGLASELGEEWMARIGGALADTEQFGGQKGYSLEAISSRLKGAIKAGVEGIAVEGPVLAIPALLRVPVKSFASSRYKTMRAGLVNEYSDQLNEKLGINEDSAKDIAEKAVAEAESKGEGDFHDNVTQSVRNQLGQDKSPLERLQEKDTQTQAQPQAQVPDRQQVPESESQAREETPEVESQRVPPTPQEPESGRQGVSVEVGLPAKEEAQTKDTALEDMLEQDTQQGRTEGGLQALGIDVVADENFPIEKGAVTAVNQKTGKLEVRYNPKVLEIRPDTLAHEFGHAVDIQNKLRGNLTKAEAEELATLYGLHVQDFFPDMEQTPEMHADIADRMLKTPEGGYEATPEQREEGFAEGLSMFVRNPAKAREAAPLLAKRLGLAAPAQQQAPTWIEPDLFEKWQQGDLTSAEAAEESLLRKGYITRDKEGNLGTAEKASRDGLFEDQRQGHNEAIVRAIEEGADELDALGQPQAPAKTYEEAITRPGNPYVKRSEGKDNSGRTLMVQFASDLLYTAGEDFGSHYYNKLYNGRREGYLRPGENKITSPDFWEIPVWQAELAGAIPDKADTYVVRNMDEAKKFLADAGYGSVAMSVLDVNKKQAKELTEALPGVNFVVGGYAEDMGDVFKGMDNVKQYDSIESFVKDRYPGSKGKGYDFSNFAGTQAIPRLCLSKGCKYHCVFCGVEPHGQTTPLSKAEIDAQVDAFAKLNAKLVYLDDKTFGQTKNYKMLPEIFSKLKKRIPGFKGFIIQTTAADLNSSKFSPDYLRSSGIRYVELGVETYNDDILKITNKPARRKTINRATDWARRNNINVIANVMVGNSWSQEMSRKVGRNEPGEETEETYKNTFDWLVENSDIISHLNIYNFVPYANTEAGQQLETQDVTDQDENNVARSYHRNPELHEKWYNIFTRYASELLDTRPIIEEPYVFATHNKNPNLSVVQAQELAASKEQRRAMQDIEEVLGEYGQEAKARKAIGITEGWGSEPSTMASLRNIKAADMPRAVERIRVALNDQDSVYYMYPDERGLETAYQAVLPRGMSIRQYDRRLTDAGFNFDRSYVTEDGRTYLFAIDERGQIDGEKLKQHVEQTGQELTTQKVTTGYVGKQPEQRADSVQDTGPPQGQPGQRFSIEAEELPIQQSLVKKRHGTTDRIGIGKYLMHSDGTMTLVPEGSHHGKVTMNVQVDLHEYIRSGGVRLGVYPSLVRNEVEVYVDAETPLTDAQEAALRRLITTNYANSVTVDGPYGFHPFQVSRTVVPQISKFLESGVRPVTRHHSIEVVETDRNHIEREGTPKQKKMLGLLDAYFGQDEKHLQSSRIGKSAKAIADRWRQKRDYWGVMAELYAQAVYELALPSGVKTAENITGMKGILKNPNITEAHREQAALEGRPVREVAADRTAVELMVLGGKTYHGTIGHTWRKIKEFENRPMGMTKAEGEGVGELSLDQPAGFEQELGELAETFSATPRPVRTRVEISYRRMAARVDKDTHGPTWPITGANRPRTKQGWQLAHEMVEDMVLALFKNREGGSFKFEGKGIQIHPSPLTAEQIKRIEDLEAEANRLGIDPYAYVWQEFLLPWQRSVAKDTRPLKLLWDNARQILTEAATVVWEQNQRKAIAENPHYHEHDGVHKGKGGKWKVAVRLEGKRQHIGTAATREEAVQLRRNYFIEQYGKDYHQFDMRSKPRVSAWPSYRDNNARQLHRVLKPQMIVRTQNTVSRPNSDLSMPPAMASIIDRHRSASYSGEHVTIVYAPGRYTRKPTAAEIINNRGKEWYNDHKGQRIEITGRTYLDRDTGRIVHEVFNPGVSGARVLAEEIYHGVFEIIRLGSPRRYDQIQKWHANRAKLTGQSVDEAFAQEMALIEVGLQGVEGSDLPKPIIDYAQAVMSGKAKVKPQVATAAKLMFADPSFSIEDRPNVLLKSYILDRLDKKAMLSKAGKPTGSANRLAVQVTGKPLSKMSDEEMVKFGRFVDKLPAPTYNNKGERIPPSIPNTTALVPQGYYERTYREPSIFKQLTSQEVTSQRLGAKDVVEQAEIGKLKHTAEYGNLSNAIGQMLKRWEKIYNTKLSSKVWAKVRGEPTPAIERLANLLDQHEEAPDVLSPAEKQVFNFFRSLTREMLRRENEVRKAMGIDLIPSRKAYFRHVASSIGEEILAGRYPFPEGRKFWAGELISKKIYNPMEMQRKIKTLEDDVDHIFSRDVGYAMRAMVWNALKEIHLTRPLRYMEQQLTMLGKDLPTYENLTEEEQARWDKVEVMPARTRRWYMEYINTVIKGQMSRTDENINAIVTKTGLGGIINTLLRPFGRALSHKPVSNALMQLGRYQILGVMGGFRPRQLIRNKFQLVQNLALYPLHANARAFRKPTPQLQRLLDKSVFLQSYTGTEEWPAEFMGMVSELALRPFQWTATTNARQSMEVAYWAMLPLFNDSKYSHHGWADPHRTYEEAPEFLYPSEEERMLKEMEWGAAATQFHYSAIGMPEVFRHKTMTWLTRLNSWWMNYYSRFLPEAFNRAFFGRTRYTEKGGPTLPWSYRMGWMRYMFIGGLILNTMGYMRSYLFGVAPTGVPPSAQFAKWFYFYVIARGTGDGRLRQKASRGMYDAAKTFIPFYMTFKDWQALLTGRKPLKDFFFYNKGPKNPPLELRRSRRKRRRARALQETG